MASKTLTLTFTQPWHYSLDGVSVLRVSPGEVAELPEHLAASALGLKVATLAAGTSAPLAEGTKAVPAAEPVSLAPGEVVVNEVDTKQVEADLTASLAQAPAAKPGRKGKK